MPLHHSSNGGGITKESKTKQYQKLPFSVVMEGHHILSGPVIRNVIPENNASDYVINRIILILLGQCLVM